MGFPRVFPKNRGAVTEDAACRASPKVSGPFASLASFAVKDLLQAAFTTAPALVASCPSRQPLQSHQGAEVVQDAGIVRDGSNLEANRNA